VLLLLEAVVDLMVHNQTQIIVGLHLLEEKILVDHLCLVVVRVQEVLLTQNLLLDRQVVAHLDIQVR
jgi:hypothetical protein